MGSGPFKFVAYDIGQSIKGERNPDYYHKGLPYLDGFVGIFADKQVGAGRCDPRRPRGDGVPRPAAVGDQRSRAGTRRQDQGADQRLELRQPDHAEPAAQAVRRRAGAPGAAAGDRPVARRAGAVEDRQRAHGGRHRVPGLAARRDQGRAAEDGRVLARYREVARRGAAPAEGGGRRRACTFELLNRNVDQPYKYVGTWLVDQWSKIGVTATQRVVPTGPWFAGDAQRRLRRRGGGQLQQRGESGAGHAEIPAARRVRGELWRLQDPEEVDIYDKMLRETDFDEAAGADAAVRDAHRRHRGARVPDALVVSHHPGPVLCARAGRSARATTSIRTWPTSGWTGAER